MVRNFYIKGAVDGRKTDITGGSSRRDGGMRLTLTQRNEGTIEKCVDIECVVDGEELVTAIYDKQGNMVFQNKTKR